MRTREDVSCLSRDDMARIDRVRLAAFVEAAMAMPEEDAAEHAGNIAAGEHVQILMERAAERGIRWTIRRRGLPVLGTIG